LRKVCVLRVNAINFALEKFRNFTGGKSVESQSSCELVFFLLSALKIHCSAACETLLTQLRGYTLVERGVVRLKGKGDVTTFWLLGEDASWRETRSKQRAERRAALRQHNTLRPPDGGPTRSSLKKSPVDNDSRTFNVCDSDGSRSRATARSVRLSRSSPRDCPLARCASLESSKRLRFADYPPLLGSIKDGSPGRPCTDEDVDDDARDQVKSKDSICDHLSASCPCVDRLVSSLDTFTKVSLVYLKKKDVYERLISSVFGTLSKISSSCRATSICVAIRKTFFGRCAF